MPRSIILICGREEHGPTSSTILLLACNSRRLVSPKVPSKDCRPHLDTLSIVKDVRPQPKSLKIETDVKNEMPGVSKMQFYKCKKGIFSGFIVLRI